MDLSAIENRLAGSRLRTRFAPSPSGYLHLGHVAHCIFVWGIARALKGNVLLRIEDHDRQRSKPKFVESIQRDLEWLGFMPDDGYGFGGKTTDYVQSTDISPYQKAMISLTEMGSTYQCYCSRKQIKTRMHDKDPRCYDGYCRINGVFSQKDASVRLKVSNDQVHFWDCILGDSFQNPSTEFGDPMLVDKHGNYSYHLSVVVDDLRHNINVVIRGLDLFAATSVQISLRNMLQAGDELPIYAHHPLLYQKHNPTAKLSKRNWDESIESLRNKGYTPAQLIGKVANEVGLTKKNRDLSVSELHNLWGS